MLPVNSLYHVLSTVLQDLYGSFYFRITDKRHCTNRQVQLGWILEYGRVQTLVLQRFTLNVIDALLRICSSSQ